MSTSEAELVGNGESDDDDCSVTPLGSKSGSYSFNGSDIANSPRDSLASIPQVSHSSMFSLDDFETSRDDQTSQNEGCGTNSGLPNVSKENESGQSKDPDDILKDRTHRDIVVEAKHKLSQRISNCNVNDYYFLKFLGEGSFSSVFLSNEIPTGGYYAVKVMNKDTIRRERKLANVLREKDIMASITHNFGGHPFVIKLRCAFQDDRRLFFVMKVARYGELYRVVDHFQKLDASVTKFYISEIVAALNFIHHCRIVHRDLKPENILLNDNFHILITDFGSAKLVGNKEQETLESEELELRKAQKQTRGSFVGTAQYAAPEILASKCASYEADFWAVGIVLVQMLTGSTPFNATNEYHIMRRVMNLEFDMPTNISQEAKDLIQKLLVLDPMQRLGSVDHGGSMGIRQHPYFHGVDWDNITTLTPPDLLTMMSEKFLRTHTFPPVNDDIKPGLDEDAIIRMASACEDEDESNLTPEELKKVDLIKQSIENTFHQFTNNNLIIKQGYLDKRKGLFARRRMFLLTEGPHLFYIDPVSMELRGEVPFYKEMRTEARNFRSFHVHVPGRTYLLLDPQRGASAWCQAIDEVRDLYMDKLPTLVKVSSLDKSSNSTTSSSKSLATIKRPFGRK